VGLLCRFDRMGHLDNGVVMAHSGHGTGTLKEALPRSVRRRGRPRRQAEPAQEVRDVSFHRVIGEPQANGNVGIAQALGNEPEDLDLAWREGLARAVGRRGPRRLLEHRVGAGGLTRGTQAAQHVTGRAGLTFGGGPATELLERPREIETRAAGLKGRAARQVPLDRLFEVARGTRVITPHPADKAACG